MEILCTLSFASSILLFIAVGYMIYYLRAERARRTEADEAHFKLLSEISQQFASMLDALAVAGVVERTANVAKGVSLQRWVNLDPEQLARVDALAEKLGMTREEAIACIAQEGFRMRVGQPVLEDQKDDAHCKGLLCTGEATCTCMCVGCRRAGRAS